jgi:pimeloyl-ACP methyl ester carboxylesterase
VAQLLGVQLAFRTEGNPGDKPLVLVRGLSTQMIEWGQPLIDQLVLAGHYVILFDNRDVGLSSDFGNKTTDGIAYSLRDMAGDIIGLLDHLDISSAHIAGMSMGGMIVQHAALRFPDRVRSMTSIMSSSGKPSLPPPSTEAMFYLTATPEDPGNLDQVLALGVEGRLCFDGPGYPVEPEVHKANLKRAMDRAYRPAGVARQMAAIAADGGRYDELAQIRVPTMVIHGTDDALIPLAHGLDTARSIPNARMEVVEGMGHALPDSLAPLIAELIRSHTGDLDS